MISHRHGFATTRRACEQLHPGRAWRRGSPATYSRLRATRVAEPAGSGWMPLRPVSEVLPGRHVGASGRRPGSLPEVHPNHDAGFSLPVVVVRARFGLLPRIGRDQFSSGSNVGLASGAESRSALTRSSDGPRPGGARYIPQPSWTVIPSRSDARPRHFFNQALNDCTDRLEVIVHRIAPLSATLRVSCQACGHPHGAREGALVRRSPASPGGGNGRHPAGRRGPPGQGTNRP